MGSNLTANASSYVFMNVTQLVAARASRESAFPGSIVLLNNTSVFRVSSLNNGLSNSIKTTQIFQISQSSVTDLYVHDNFTIVEYQNLTLQALIRPALPTGNASVPKSGGLIQQSATPDNLLLKVIVSPGNPQ